MIIYHRELGDVKVIIISAKYKTGNLCHLMFNSYLHKRKANPISVKPHIFFKPDMVLEQYRFKSYWRHI